MKKVNRKALIVCHKASMAYSFLLPSAKLLVQLGYEVYLACDFVEMGTIDDATCEKLKEELLVNNIKRFQVDFPRSPLSITKDLHALKQLKKIFNENKFDLVHCHTPIGGALTRYIARKYRRHGTTVIYTTHGFHFYKGAPKKNWMIYYPIEKICSKWTDVLITINKEDYEFAKKKMKAKRVEYVPGVGIDVKKFSSVVVDKNKKREELGIPENAYLILSVGELNQNKNHQVVIKAISKLNNPNIHYAIAGIGDQKENLEKLAKDLNVNLHLLGYRKDVAELYKIADLFVHPSFREGLPVSVMEAVASKVDCVCSNIRGCSDIVKNDLFDSNDSETLSLLINEFENGKSNKEVNFLGLSQFDFSIVNEELVKQYKNVMSKS